MGFLSQEATSRLFSFANSSYRPAQIVRINNAISRETRIAEAFAFKSGIIDFARARMIVSMMLERDRLYALWAKGFIY